MSMQPVTVTMQVAADVPAHDRWLGSEETAILARMRVPKRREDWRLGRWTAKQAVARALRLRGTDDALARIAILAADDGAPEVSVDGGDAGLAISISHRDGMATCVVGPAGVALGCDLETIEQRSSGFVADYFTDAERARIENTPARARAALVALMWSAKESTLKARRTGLREDTRTVEVKLEIDATEDRTSPAWHPFTAHHFPTGADFSGWWRTGGALVLTVAGRASWDPPLLAMDAAEVVMKPKRSDRTESSRQDPPKRGPDDED
ncbi:MAG: 4'-phosphopantetheinyl transferase family protein [Actinomycetota bacterium]